MPLPRLPARDRQQPEEGVATVAESAVDNLLREAGRAPPTSHALREVWGTCQGG
jgi:hypothetical protein